LERANSTPLIYGPPGSQLDLSLSALFFEGEPLAELSMIDFETLADMGLGTPLPILRTHSARGFPIVGIDIDRHFPDDLQVCGDHTHVPPSREPYPLCSHPVV
ncbi:MAG: hypothetical protein ACU0B1_03605, partial [Thermohalobaculum sp.]